MALVGASRSTPLFQSSLPRTLSERVDRGLEVFAPAGQVGKPVAESFAAMKPRCGSSGLPFLLTGVTCS